MLGVDMFAMLPRKTRKVKRVIGERKRRIEIREAGNETTSKLYSPPSIIRSFVTIPYGLSTCEEQAAF
jgi:hypothetical protein